ncbi:protein NUCLEAR FUSION DEFECTIVE 6, mitochondrial isoform X2 [Alnus glutinosa]|uniref:protein NUCLEAR FUSION DEFECTIVE 6, mitochondrial isoform X2 n=1 Tax=Alnus glutinosa TaxID=3517 RepID=UPI002D774273|nr:protein NUCLEAR FUSION DEFECTIVE 6, mitochondrial isoform X2 [Alnus glutinosa]XP_062162915.1 protein NUCLEAR FUSION DEFECTIVE 6, mitochondrial isoform X2 [Alnus glutinosa]
MSSAAAATAARSALRSTAARAATASRLTAGVGAKARPASSPFRIPKQNSLAHRIFRSPVEMSCCVETMLPYHTATASALLTSMLSVSRSYGWTPEGQEKTR